MLVERREAQRPRGGLRTPAASRARASRRRGRIPSVAGARANPVAQGLPPWGLASPRRLPALHSPARGCNGTRSSAPSLAAEAGARAPSPATSGRQLAVRTGSIPCDSFATRPENAADRAKWYSMKRGRCAGPALISTFSVPRNRYAASPSRAISRLLPARQLALHASRITSCAAMQRRDKLSHELPVPDKMSRFDSNQWVFRGATNSLLPIDLDRYYLIRSATGRHAVACSKSKTLTN